MNIYTLLLFIFITVVYYLWVLLLVFKILNINKIILYIIMYFLWLIWLKNIQISAPQPLRGGDNNKSYYLITMFDKFLREKEKKPGRKIKVCLLMENIFFYVLWKL